MLHKICNLYILIYLTAYKRLNQAAVATRAEVVLTSNLTIALQTSADYCRENAPTSNKVAAIISNAAAAKTSYLVVLTARNLSMLYTVSAAHLLYIPLYYVLMFLNSDPRQAPSLTLLNYNCNCVQEHVTQQ